MMEYATYGNGNATTRRYAEAIAYSRRTGFKTFRSIGVDSAGGTIFTPCPPAPASTPRRPTARTSSDYTGRLAQITRELRLAQIKLEIDRGQHLERLEREIEKARALRRGSASHFGVEMYTAGPYAGPLIRSFR
jgi:hypothetical protein